MIIMATIFFTKGESPRRKSEGIPLLSTTLFNCPLI